VAIDKVGAIEKHASKLSQHGFELFAPAFTRRPSLREHAECIPRRARDGLLRISQASNQSRNRITDPQSTDCNDGVPSHGLHGIVEQRYERNRYVVHPRSLKVIVG
jgi:hypothetical protein